MSIINKLVQTDNNKIYIYLEINRLQYFSVLHNSQNSFSDFQCTTTGAAEATTIQKNTATKKQQQKHMCDSIIYNM